MKQKADAPAPAGELYRSDWFRKARAYVRGLGVRWFILSAEHGLLDPSRVVAPYERSLHAMSPQERQAWGERVAAQLQTVAPAPCPVVFLAGRLYRDALSPWVEDRASVPMAGLGIGQQKAWLYERTTNPAQLDMFEAQL